MRLHRIITPGLLERMRKAIEGNLLNKSDKYHKLDLGYPIVAVESPGGYQVSATGISDSSIWLKVFESKAYSDVPSFLSACDVAGAYTATGWELLRKQPEVTVKQMIDHFKIKDYIRPLLRTPLIAERDAECIITLLSEWAAVREQFTDEECYAMDELAFMRKTRRKKSDGEKDPACFDGLCLDRKLAGIYPNVRDAAW